MASSSISGNFKKKVGLSVIRGNEMNHTVKVPCIPYIWLFWLCEILALLGQNGGKEIMAHINFGSPRV